MLTIHSTRMMRFMRFRIRELDRLYICGNVGGTWSDVDWSNISLTDERFNKNTSGFKAVARATISNSATSCWVWEPL